MFNFLTDMAAGTIVCESSKATLILGDVNKNRGVEQGDSVGFCIVEQRRTRGGWRRPQEEFEANTKLDIGFDEPSICFQKRMQSDPNSTCICAGLLLSDCTRKEGVVGDQALRVRFPD